MLVGEIDGEIDGEEMALAESCSLDGFPGGKRMTCTHGKASWGAGRRCPQSKLYLYIGGKETENGEWSARVVIIA